MYQFHIRFSKVYSTEVMEQKGVKMDQKGVEIIVRRVEE